MGAKAVNKINDSLKKKLTSALGDYVEIGGENGDGSTMLLYSIKNKDKNSKLFSVDPNWGKRQRDSHRKAFNLLNFENDDLNVDDVFLEKTTGEIFLESEFEKKSQSKKIKFMYLDALDFAYPEAEPIGANYDKKTAMFLNPENLSDYMKKQINGYKNHEYNTLNNFNSIKCHIDCAKLFLKFCSDYCLILIDDTYYDYDGDFQGKGAQAIPFLLQNGFSIIESGTSKNHKYKTPQKFRNSFLEDVLPNAYFLLEKK